jgi:hypothetical protein
MGWLVGHVVQWQKLQWPKLEEQGRGEWLIDVMVWADKLVEREARMVSHGDGHGIADVPLMTMQLGVGSGAAPSHLLHGSKCDAAFS